MLVQYSQPSLVASDKPAEVLLVLQSEHGTAVEAEPAYCTPTPREPSPNKGGNDTIPQAIQLSLSSPDEAVAGPSHTSSPLDDFKEHQTLLKWVTENLCLQIDLFNVISATTPAKIALAVHPALLKIAKLVLQVPLSIPLTE